MDSDTPPAAARPPVPEVTWLDHAGSTQQLVLEAAADAPRDWPHLRAVATLDQRTGRGRQGRDWTTPAGTALSVSVVLRLRVPFRHWSWATLIAAAVTAGELDRRGIAATVKWPNDVLAPDGRKLCGILAGVLPDQSGIVLGLGLNLDFGPEGPPVPTATSMAEWLPGDAGDHGPAGGTSALAVDVLDALLRSLGEALAAFEAAIGGPGADPDADVDGTHPAVGAVVERLGTLGAEVRAELPGGTTLAGTARGLGPGGTLLIEPADRGRIGAAVAGASRRGELLEVSAADVVHLRR
ncbi:biotin--[acetyl-CoA-carboxylase] ligase [Citricoccus zhacaiensis]|uniref:biotin--[acetyl-CoA-carboxylase] ligase n=1 Tax=Citricoccus zhacaiensis TaxID=489142 RepID=UPI003CF89A5C